MFDPKLDNIILFICHVNIDYKQFLYKLRCKIELKYTFQVGCIRWNFTL